MALGYFSKFYYDLVIDNENRFLNISEGGGPELSVELVAGSYSFTEGAVMIQTAFNATGLLGYTVNPDRVNRTFEISATGNWEALIQSGTLGANQAWDQIGFGQTIDLTGANNYEGNAPAVQVYEPQYWLQDFTPTSDKKRASEATVRKTATGAVEVVTFGTESFMKCSIKYATSKTTDGKVILYNPTGLEDLRAFMEFCITKAKLEFMVDADQPNNYQTMILEKTEQDQNGVEFELREMVSQNLPDFYEVTGLVFRLIE